MNLKISGKKATPPKFSKHVYHVNVLETEKVGETIEQVSASRMNKVYGKQLNYEIIAGNRGDAFAIDTREGFVKVRVDDNVFFF